MAEAAALKSPTMPRINAGIGFAQVAFLSINAFIELMPKMIGIIIKGRVASERISEKTVTNL